MGGPAGPRPHPPNPGPVRHLSHDRKGFEHEHNVEKLTLGVVVLETANNQMASYERLLDDLIRQIQKCRAGTGGPCKRSRTLTLP
jgi:hypothetical protein